ncbi:TerC/Alx family metal homeostasis membrane protein [Thermomonospora cellulosilytica]|uniref:Tellurite resistance protein TerC n=1 Tax=Thermomonospora cellulosilytica TaxID=1411118 RepID=A0A7W3R7U7_9ACTN|nr:TerC/Alx family metal homeostasis membrane protein [Thermomonospora cellulosilytica]MBA9003001.1 tellurite resistance protein TerC [Thermomonospora cellulosilytica]
MNGFAVEAWAAMIGLIVVLFTFDLFVAVRRPHAVGLVEATVWSVFYIAVAVGFGLVLWATAGAAAGTEYFAGWVVEKSLSVDNLFVFSIIFARFAVPAEYRQKILLFGIAFALCLRAVFIAIGAAAISLFSFTFLLFGLVLLWTAVQLIRHRNEDPDVEDTWLVRRARQIMPVGTGYHGGRMLAVEDGRRVVTPVLLVFLAIGSTDLLFALDSIPAVFGVTAEPFIVLAANAFALLGLRALFFLIEGLLERLVYLAIGLSLILALIGVKLVLLFLHRDVTAAVPEIPTPLSLGLILLILIATTIASVLRVRAHPEERAHPGAVRVRRTPPDDRTPPPAGGHPGGTPPP